VERGLNIREDRKGGGPGGGKKTEAKSGNNAANNVFTDPNLDYEKGGGSNGNDPSSPDFCPPVSDFPGIIFPDDEGGVSKGGVISPRRIPNDPPDVSVCTLKKIIHEMMRN
jgi:hypothetical protein